MDRRNFMAKTTLATAAPVFITPFIMQMEKELYELRVYDLVDSRKQTVLLSYFKEVLIPAYQRAGVSAIGVFKEMGRSEPPKIYLLLPHTSFETYAKCAKILNMDNSFREARKSFDHISQADKVYTRFDTELMLAFDGLPKINVPEKDDRIFELRTYEGYNEDAVHRKEIMFDKDELDLFYEKKLNPVFFGKVIAGKDLPKLTYMLTFKDLKERDENWKNFFIDNPIWDRISKAPEYANTVSKVKRTFLEPLAISQI